MTPLHLGALHPVEQAVTIALAFGPFLVLGIVIVLRRRAEADADLHAGTEENGGVAAEGGAGAADPGPDAEPR
ncbi:hypothetical protein [Nocardioides sp. SYSU DS0651]|uniref:hypothetical protein n=1 Tax=Nocardioides sp. SYSU DS0651 TaxID=3415955 RepID=UPI003F4B1EAA